MNKYLLTPLLYLILIVPVMANDVIEKEQSLITTVLTLKNIVQNSLNEKQAESEFNKIPQTKPFLKDGRYAGQKLFENNKLTGLLQVSYQKNTPVMAAFSSTPLKVRHATKMYKTYRTSLLKHFKEISHNHFELGDGVVAELHKKKNGLSIFVSRK